MSFEPQHFYVKKGGIISNNNNDGDDALNLIS